MCLYVPVMKMLMLPWFFFFYFTVLRMNSSVNAKQTDNKELRFLNFSGKNCLLLFSFSCSHAISHTHTSIYRVVAPNFACVNVFTFIVLLFIVVVFRYSWGFILQRIFGVYSRVVLWWIYYTIFFLLPIHRICVVRHAVHNPIHFQNPIRWIARTRVVCSSCRRHFFFFIMLLHFHSLQRFMSCRNYLAFWL